MPYPTRKWTKLLILCMIFLGAWFRASAYGDLRLSVGMADTPSYVSSASVPLFSWEAFSGSRMFTTNLLYKLAAGPACSAAPFSKPGIGEEAVRTVEVCFYRIALLQNILSITGWCFLAWVISRRLEHAPYKFSAVVIILIFGFSPQIAEWDSVLSSESPSLSLFPIMLGVLVEIIFSFAEDPKRRRVAGLVILWVLLQGLWGFLREVQLYGILTSLVLITPLLAIKRFRQTRILPAVLCALLGIFMLGSLSSRQSPRWRLPLEDALNTYIFPYPARVDYFRSHGMPDEASSDEYRAWFTDRASRTYVFFLLSHPGVVINTLWEQADYFRSDFVQPYFEIPHMQMRATMLNIGELVHPQTYAVYLFDLLLLFSIWAAAIKTKDQTTLGWAWLAGWIFLYASLSLFMSFFGDSDGIRRHIFPPVESFRLFVWIFLIVQIDLLLTGRLPGLIKSDIP